MTDSGVCGPETVCHSTLCGAIFPGAEDATIPGAAGSAQVWAAAVAAAAAATGPAIECPFISGSFSSHTCGRMALLPENNTLSTSGWRVALWPENRTSSASAA
ncbi:hypothetical protein D3C81_1642850 [compost metagenome]